MGAEEVGEGRRVKCRRGGERRGGGGEMRWGRRRDEVGEKGWEHTVRAPHNLIPMKLKLDQLNESPVT